MMCAFFSTFRTVLGDWLITDQYCQIYETFGDIRWNQLSQFLIFWGTSNSDFCSNTRKKSLPLHLCQLSLRYQQKC